MVAKKHDTSDETANQSEIKMKNRICAGGEIEFTNQWGI